MATVRFSNHDDENWPESTLFAPTRYVNIGWKACLARQCAGRYAKAIVEAFPWRPMMRVRLKIVLT